MLKKVVTGIAIGCVLGLLVLAVGAQEQKQPTDQEMQAMMAAATPGPHHAELMKSAGTYDVSVKTMMPGVPPTESKGTATIEGILDGRFIVESMKSPNFMGGPWEGRGIYGYDNTTKKHVGTWCDSWGTMLMNMEGTCDGSCKVVTLTSNFVDPATKTTKTMKAVSKEISADEFVLELSDVEKGGKETKMMEINYKRKKP